MLAADRYSQSASRRPGGQSERKALYSLVDNPVLKNVGKNAKENKYTQKAREGAAR